MCCFQKENNASKVAAADATTTTTSAAAAAVVLTPSLNWISPSSGILRRGIPQNTEEFRSSAVETYDLTVPNCLQFLESRNVDLKTHSQTIYTWNV